MRISRLLLLLSALAVLAIPAAAQVSSTAGAVRVHVVDTSGAAVAHVPVVLINKTIGLRREAVTQDDGSYVFPLVPPAQEYQVEVTAPNFAKGVLQNLIVRVNEVADANITLQVATAVEKVVVTAAQETVQTTSPTTGNTIPGEVIEQLPIFRDPLALIGTDAGVTSDQNGGVSVTGSRGTANNYLLNGTDANNFEFNEVGSGVVPDPDPDAIEELKTQTSLFDATSGRSAGGNFSLVTRSGTDHYHGGVYEFNENSVFGANDWFRNAFGVPNPERNKNIFGGRFGGPVPLLRHTYFFVNYEGVRETSPSNVQGFMPVFPATRDAASLAQAFDVPQSAIDPVAVAALNLKGPFNGFLVPSANQGNSPVGQLGEFFAVSNNTFTQNQVSAKLDNESSIAGHNNRVTLSGYWYKDEDLNPIESFAIGASQQFNNNFPSYVLEDTFFINNNILNSFTVGFAEEAILGNNDTTPIPLTAIGMTRFNQQLFPDLPSFSFTDQFSGIGSNPERMPHQRSHTDTLRDIITIEHGKHTIRVGGETRWNTFRFNEQFDFRGLLSFGSTFGPDNADRLFGAPATGGDLSIRDMLIGAPDGISIASGASRFDYAATDYAAFVQDDYRLSSRLTLNLGLRWDLFGNINEQNGDISTLDLSRVPASAALNGGPGLQAGFLVPAGDPSFGVPGVPKSTILNWDKKNFEPRIGMAYDVFGNGKLAVRSGFGMFYSRYSAIGPLQTSSQPPFSLSVANSNFNSDILANPFPVLPLPSQFPVFPAFPAFTGIDPTFGQADFSANGVPGAFPIALSGADPNAHTPYEEKWNLTTQYEFLPGWAVEVGYVGSHGVRLLDSRALNAPLLRNDNNPGPGGLDVNSAFNFNARTAVVGISAFSSFQTTDASSWYDGLLLTVSHQYSKGLYFKAAYTYSHAIDNQSGGDAGEFDVGEVLGNQFLLNENKGSSDFDIRHRLALTYTYALPGPHNGILARTLGGWNLSGITTIQSGLPFSIAQFIDDFSGFPGFAGIIPGCKVYNSGSLQSFANPFTATSYVNPNCFTVSAPIAPGATFGPTSPIEGPGNQMYTVDPTAYPGEAGLSSGALQGPDTRNLLRGPWFEEWDMSLAKKIAVPKLLGESGAITIRADAANVINHPSFGPPIPQFSFLPFDFITDNGANANNNPSALGPGFGKIQFTENSPRVLQLAIRFDF